MDCNGNSRVSQVRVIGIVILPGTCPFTWLRLRITPGHYQTGLEASAATTTADTVDGITTSVANLIAAPGADGRISLREAIQATNATGGNDTIRFGIPLSDAGHFYYQDDVAAGLSTVAVTPLADADIADFDPDYPAGFTRSWYRIQPNPALDAIVDPVVGKQLGARGGSERSCGRFGFPGRGFR